MKKGMAILFIIVVSFISTIILFVSPYIFETSLISFKDIHLEFLIPFIFIILCYVVALIFIKYNLSISKFIINMISVATLIFIVMFNLYNLLNFSRNMEYFKFGFYWSFSHIIIMAVINNNLKKIILG
jgi:hypothetical protein